MINNSDYEKDWIKNLFDDRYRFQKFSPELRPELNELISHICENLSLSAEIEFTCYANVQYFFEIHFQKLERHINIKKKSTASNWEESLTSFEERTVLFIMNVIFICTKYVDNTTIISTAPFLEFLKKCYRPCKLNDFKQTEFQVFHSLDFKILPPTAYYSAMYYLQLCTVELASDNKNIYTTLRDMLRISFLRRNYIYDRIDPNAIGNIEGYKSDQALLGVANVLATFEIFKYPPQRVIQSLQFLSVASGLPAKDIQLLSSSIIYVFNNM